MKVDPFRQRIESEGSLVGDEMHLVTSSSEPHAQFCSDHSTTTMSRMTGDGDLQLRSSLF